MFMTDALTFDAPKRTKEGFLAVRAKAARTGVYDYLGSEVDPKGERFKPNDTVKVYRAEDEVFSHKAVHSFLMKPITNEHPKEAVTADNWKDHAGGIVAKAMRDGDHLAFDLVMMDAALIRDIEAGKRELSNGYGCELVWGDGVSPNGEKYHATQTNISGNHVAVVDRGRAGPDARITDSIALCDSIPAALLANLHHDTNGDISMKTLTIDGLKVPNVSDEAEAAILKLQGQITGLTTAKDTAETKVVELTTTVSTKDAEIVTLKQAATDAKLTPQQLRDAAKAYAITVETAKKLAPNAGITDAMDEIAIKKLVVTARLGDAAKDWNDAQVETSFATLAASVTSDADPLRNVITSGTTNVADARAVVSTLRAARYN